MSGNATPWIEGDLVIDEAVLQDMQAHALQCYPSECCGWATGPADRPAELTASVREENEADKYHKLDPETFPRTSKTYFRLNDLRAGRALDAGRDSGQPMKVIYHSHCDAGAYFSAEDAATFTMDNQLTWPCAFIVISVMEGKLAETKLWVHVPGSNDFRESPLTVR